MKTSLNFSNVLVPSFRVALAAAGSLGVLALAACGSDDSSSAPGPTVVASTTQVADLARGVGGDRAGVVGMLSANADPHEFEPSPSDAEALVDAELVLGSGGDVDVWLDDLVSSSGTEAPTVELIDHVETLEGEHEHHEGEEHETGVHADEGSEHADDLDPHWWQDPANATLAVEAIREVLTEADPDGAADYERNAAALERELESLDRAIERCVESIPPDRRKLVTTHDSLEYFAHRYGLEVVGATIPALTTQAQPSAGETANLIELIDSEDVAAVFPEAGVSAEVEEAIAEETDAQLGAELYADALGPEGSGAETYAGALAANAQTIGEGLGGDPGACELGL
jgi:ABC-type Zn uptake system ZnuABC Zn-binding protein ZnuA